MRKHTRRKVWSTSINPVAHAIAGAAITDSGRLDKLRMVELAAIESFRIGRATPDDWRALADMLNVAETMARMGIGPEVLPACESAQEALSHAHQRYTAGKTLGLTGPELQTLRDLHEYHDLQRQSVARSEYEKAIEKTANRIRSAHRDVKVCIA